MDKYTTYIGMDVHARSITAKGVNKKTGEGCSKRFCAGYSAAEIASWLAKLEGPVYCAYESGCTGVWLARDLRALGYDCDVVAVSTLARSVKDRQGKCDKIDAKAILAAITSPFPTHSVVWVPDEHQEGEREVTRLYAKVRDSAKRAKQELSSFLMRQGWVFNEKTPTGRIKKPSGRAYKKWLDSIEFSDKSMQTVFLELRRRAEETEAEKKRIKALVVKQARKPENAPYVSAFTCMKGIDEVTAETARAEIGDFERFSSGRKVSCWTGTVPENASSGEKEHHGPITHAGNTYLRRALVEGVGTISCWKRPYKSPPEEGVAPEALAAAKCANERLFKRYHHLKDDLSKPANVAKVAVVNELIRWVWVIGREIQRSEGRAA